MFDDSSVKFLSNIELKLQRLIYTRAQLYGTRYLVRPLLGFRVQSVNNKFQHVLVVRLVEVVLKSSPMKINELVVITLLTLFSVHLYLGQSCSQLLSSASQRQVQYKRHCCPDIATLWAAKLKASETSITIITCVIDS